MQPPDNQTYRMPDEHINFGWIGEAWRYFWQASGTWSLSALIVGLQQILVCILIAAATGQLHMIVQLIATHGQSATLNPNTFSYMAYTDLYSLAVFAIGTTLYAVALSQIRGGPVSINLLFTTTRTMPTIIAVSALMAVLLGLSTEMTQLAQSALGVQTGTGAAATMKLIRNEFIGMGIGIVSSLLMSIPRSLLMFAPLVAIDRGVGFRESVRTSVRLVARDWPIAALFYVVLDWISSLGICACCVGLFVTVPLFYLSVAYGYIRLTDASRRLPGYGPDIPGVWPPPPSTGASDDGSTPRA